MVLLAAPTADAAILYRGEVMTDNPVAYWRLGESSGTVAADETANKYAGTYQGVIALGQPGALAGDANTAPGFDGVDDQVNMGNPAKASFGTRNFSVEAWIKPALKGSQLSADMPLVAKQPATTGKPAWELTFTRDSGYVGRVKAKLTDTSNSSAPLKAYSGVRVDDGNWHHVVANFDRANGITVYVDSVGAFTPGVTSGDVSNTTALLIGHEGRIYPYFKGQIDEVALYDGLLTAARVRSHFENGVAKSISPPANTAVPKVSGTAKNGYLLSAAAGNWTGTPPLSYAYQWRRYDSAGANCTDIAGAIQPSHSLSTADVGATVRVAVTAANAGGNSTSVSAASDIVAPGTVDPTVAAAGDISCFKPPVVTSSRCHYGIISGLIADDPRITDVLNLGDQQYDCGDFDYFQSFFDPTWGRFKSKSHPVPGNHDYYTYKAPNPDGSQDPGTRSDCLTSTTVPAAGYFDYFNRTGVQTGSAGDRDKGYYSFDVGGWHIITLNSECDRIGGCDSGSSQEKWLRTDLASHSNACTLAHWHVPRFSSGHIGGDPYLRTLWQDLYDTQADLVLNGHDHDYERFAPQTPSGAEDITAGLREFVVGTGGASHGCRPCKRIARPSTPTASACSSSRCMALATTGSSSRRRRVGSAIRARVPATNQRL